MKTEMLLKPSKISICNYRLEKTILKSNCMHLAIDYISDR